MERGDTERIDITISSRFENIELVQVIAEHLCENAGVDEDGSHWIGMAVREAVANAIKHGNKLDVRKKVNATFELEGFELEITISDEGQGFDPEKVSDPLNPQNLMKTSGRGIFYMKTFMDQVQYTFNAAGGTSLVMTKNLAKGNGIATTKA
ncbi:MAG TPA: ATP-binding protein [Thermoanaerobaculia bacterium]|jgi:serine/threonine-protein kinase RsbW|nr:ATP-binding protein [Thermoanaerobaculia bacterium]